MATRDARRSSSQRCEGDQLPASVLGFPDRAVVDVLVLTVVRILAVALIDVSLIAVVGILDLAVIDVVRVTLVLALGLELTLLPGLTVLEIASLSLVNIRHRAVINIRHGTVVNICRRSVVGFVYGAVLHVLDVALIEVAGQVVNFLCRGSVCVDGLLGGGRVDRGRVVTGSRSAGDCGASEHESADGGDDQLLVQHWFLL